MIVVVGLSHREAPIEVRERLAVDREALPALLSDLLSRSSIREAMCVSTCNRIEVYAAGKSDEGADLLAAVEDVTQVLEALAAKNGASGVRAHLVQKVGSAAVRHLFRVTASLDSLVVGEPQILGQVKEAFEAARGAGTLGRYLTRASSRAVHVAKRVRTETAIGVGQVSVSSVAVDLARQIFGNMAGTTTLLLGAGEMAEAAAKLLVKAGARLVVVNRSLERAQNLAATVGGTARPWGDLASCLVDADVVVASTSARQFVLTRTMTALAMKARRGRSLFFIDIALPRDVDPAVNDLPNVYLYDIDDLSQIVASAMTGRLAEAALAEAVIDHETEAFEKWTGAIDVAPTIVALRAKARAALVSEMDKSLAGRLKHLPEKDRQAMAVMIDAALNKLLHAPITKIKALGSDPRGDDLVQALHHLFDLPQLSEAYSHADQAEEPAEGASENKVHAGRTSEPVPQ